MVLLATTTYFIPELGNDDLIGGMGTNQLSAWSFQPQSNAADPFGVFVDSNGRLFQSDGGGTRQLEDTGLNRMLGSVTR